MPGNPFINVRPLPRYQPGKPGASISNPFGQGLINTQPNVPRGRPDSWGNSKPFNPNPPEPNLNNIPSANNGGQIIPANNPGQNGITIPSGSSSSRPANNPDNPLQTWNQNPQYGSGRPTRIPTIDVEPNPVRAPSFFNPDGDPLSNFARNIGEWFGGKVGQSIKKNWQRSSSSRRENNPTNWNDANDAYNKSKTNEEDPSIPRPGKPDTTPTLRLPVGGSGSQTIEIFFRLGSWRVEKNPTEAPYPLITSGRSPFLFSGRVEQYGNSVANYIRLYDVPFPLQYQFVNGSPHVKDANNRLIFRLTVSSETNYGELGNIQQWSGQYLDLLDIRPINYQSPMPIRNPNPFINKLNEEDDMSCRPCQAAQALRALQRTITVDGVTISRIPTGNMIQVPTTEVHRVFALPGTEQAIKRQFNLMTDIRKRLAQTFNQSRMAKVIAKLSQLMNVADFILNLHNALMLTEDIVQTFFQPLFSAVDTVASVLDDAPFIGNLFDLEEKSLNSSEIFATKFEDAMKAIFGVQGWAEIKAKWASFNNIVRGAAMQIQAVKDIHESQKELQEMTASKLGRLHNKMLKAGVIFDSSPWEENVKARSVWLNKFYKLEELADDNPITNAASYVNSWGQQVLDIKEQKKELKESQEKYQKDLRDDLNTLTTGKIKTNEDSLGSPYTRSDGNAPETDDAQ